MPVKKSTRIRKGSVINGNRIFTRIERRLVVPAVSSSYPTLGNAYKHGGYEIDHASKLVRTGKHYYDSKAEIPKGMRMSTAGEELAMQLNYEIFGEILKRATQEGIRKGGGQADLGIVDQPEVLMSMLRTYAKNEREKEAIRYVLSIEGHDVMKKGADPRKAEVFNDLFGRKNGGWYAWQLTETCLRVPKGRKADKYETDAQGRKYWVRTALVSDKEVGEVLVPEGGGRLVAEWDEVSGVPRVTVENQDWPHNPYTTHFDFNSTPDKDSTSGHYDVAVERGGRWPHAVGGRCLYVAVAYRRWFAVSLGGFRLVRGSLPQIVKN